MSFDDWNTEQPFLFTCPLYRKRTSAGYFINHRSHARYNTHKALRLIGDCDFFRERIACKCQESPHRMSRRQNMTVLYPVTVICTSSIYLRRSATRSSYHTDRKCQRVRLLRTKCQNHKQNISFPALQDPERGLILLPFRGKNRC